MSLNQPTTKNLRSSNNLYHHPLGFTCTQELRIIADQSKCYWLLRDIAFHNFLNKPIQESFQIWTLEKIKSTEYSFFLSCRNDADKLLYSAKLPYSSFPGETITIWFKEEILMLPAS